jgi:3-oxoacyl-[acyl-carrier-protein] synthase-3
VVQGRLGALRAGTFDVNSGCAGFATALDVAWKYVRADERYGRVLVVGAYAMSKFLDPGDKKTATIFADGAGAVVLEAVEGGAADDPPKRRARLRAVRRRALRAGDGRVRRRHRRAGHRGRAPRRLPQPAALRREVPGVGERGGVAADRPVGAGARRRRARRGRPVAVDAGQPLDDRERDGHARQPMARAHTVMHKWGYTGSACLPMALDDAARAGRLGPGDLVLLTGSGAGLSMASVALRWALPRREAEEPSGAAWRRRTREHGGVAEPFVRPRAR